MGGEIYRPSDIISILTTTIKALDQRKEYISKVEELGIDLTGIDDGRLGYWDIIYSILDMNEDSPKWFEIIDIITDTETAEHERAKKAYEARYV